MVNTTIASDQRLNSLSIEAEYLYLKTIPHLDRDGLIYGKANLLWAKACPERMELLPRIDALVTEWVQKSLVLKYETDNGTVLYFYGFKKNQRIRYDREAASIFAVPPGYVRVEGKDGGLFKLPDNDNSDTQPEPNQPDDDPDTDEGQPQSEPVTDELRTNSGLTPDEIPLKLREVNTNKTNNANGNSGSGGLDDCGEMFRFYQTNIGSLTAYSKEELLDYVTTYGGPDIVLDALRVAVQANVKSLRYAHGVLKKWHADGRSGKKAPGLLPSMPTTLPANVFDV